MLGAFRLNLIPTLPNKYVNRGECDVTGQTGWWL